MVGRRLEEEFSRQVLIGRRAMVVSGMTPPPKVRGVSFEVGRARSSG